MSMLGLDETMDQMAIVNNVWWYRHVSREEGGHVLGRALDVEL